MLEKLYKFIRAQIKKIMPNKNVILNRPLEIAIALKNLPNIFNEFNCLVNQSVPKNHRFYKAIDFYSKHKDQNWEAIELPDYVLKSADEIAHFVVVLKQAIIDAYDGKPAKGLLDINMIDSYCAEAMMISNYLRRGFLVQWLSIFQKDPPDLRLYHPVDKINIDIEVKVKIEEPSIEGVFDSVSKGLASLKRRGEGRMNPAIIAIHCPIDLGWVDWLNNPEVLVRLRSRLENKEYSIVSGLIFSGGHAINRPGSGVAAFTTKFIGLRSHVAQHPLPKGILTGSGDI